MANAYTHIGWFYFVPVLYRDSENDNCEMEMRWTGWQWPIVVAFCIHDFISSFMAIDSEFPIRITGKIE